MEESKAVFVPEMKYDKLFTALAMAQAEFGTAKKSVSGYNYKYADLEEVVKVSRPALTKNGLSVIQVIIPGVTVNGEKKPAVLKTILGHKSGQYIESNINLVFNEQGQGKAKNVLQSLGTSLTYLKRYSYAALVGVMVEDEDTDGVTPSYKYSK